MRTITMEDVKFTTEWDLERVYLSANYRNILSAKLSFWRPDDMFMFFKTDEFIYIKSKLVKQIQADIDLINKV